MHCVLAKGFDHLDKLETGKLNRARRTTLEHGALRSSTAHYGLASAVGEGAIRRKQATQGFYQLELLD